MDIRPSLQIQVMIKAMDQVVVPAIDPGNKIAQEQAGLVLEALRVLQDRLPIWRRYVCDELDRLVCAVAEIRECGGIGQSDALQVLMDASANGKILLASPIADASEIEDAAITLRNAIGQLMSENDTPENPVHRSELGKIVLRVSGTQLARERAWLSGFGFESDPSKIAPIEEQLGISIAN